MVKKLSVLALAATLALPAAALAGGGAADMQSQIDALNKQIEQLKSQMERMKQAPAPVAAAAPSADIQGLKAKVDALEEKSASWDEAARFHLSGDFRARYDWFEREHLTSATTSVTEENDSLFTNRFRLNMRVKALENVEFKGRLAMYKAWGMQSTPGTPGDFWGAFPPFDGNSTRQVSDNTIKLDRGFVNWDNIGGMPVWFSIGRRPTTDGPPNQLKLNNDDRLATAAAVMDWPFDGASLGYAYNNLFGIQDAPGRFRLCYGRGFEEGLAVTTAGLNDTDFGGFSWDVYQKGDRFIYLQSFAAFEVFNFPDWPDATNPPAAAYADGNRTNLGNIYHTSAVYMDKWQALNYFAAGAWSRTDPNQVGMLNDYAAGTPIPNQDSEDGYEFHLGGRYDFPDTPFKAGLEYNHGSKYWIAMTPGHDDMYASKLATRGNAYEAYGIYDIPGGEAISKYGKAFLRLGYIHYDYNYTGSMDWNVMPYAVDDGAEVTRAINNAGATVIDHADQIYLTLEAYF